MCDAFSYNQNVRDHQNIATDLGALQARILVNVVNKDSRNAWYSGYEMTGCCGALGEGEYYLKGDVVSGGNESGSGRTKRRVIVRIKKNGALDLETAWLWDHGDIIKRMNAGFLGKAMETRKMYLKEIFNKPENLGM